MIKSGISCLGRNLRERVKFTCFKMKKLRPRQSVTYKATYPDKAKQRPDAVTTNLARFLPYQPENAESLECFHASVPNQKLTKHKAVFALPGINFYDKVTVIKRVGIGVKLDRGLWDTLACLELSPLIYRILVQESELPIWFQRVAMAFNSARTNGYPYGKKNWITTSFL